MTEAEKSVNATFIEAKAQVLNKAYWYHGLMPRDEISDLLKHDGDFLVRRSELGLNQKLVISMRWSRVRHMFIKVTPEARFNITDLLNFENVERLICFYMGSKAEIFRDGAKLMRPIKRPEWCLFHENIKLNKKVGSGSFGDVYIGKLTDKDKKLDVAVKMLKGKLGKKERSGFVKEASLNRRFNHPNIVRLLGIAAQQDPIMVVLELASGGSLKGYLQKNPDASVERLNKFLLDAAKGLTYLSSLNVTHRDIAARNCLLAEDLTVKISDFGLSIAEAQVKEKKLSKVPTKWLAPETLGQGVFSTKTDVYTYGVMMWEVYTYCKADPYSKITNLEARQAIQAGKTLEIPTITPLFACKIMEDCWKKDPDARPTFGQIAERFEAAMKLN
ncbi:unnamed protein product [Bursaphelenchus okinawaensis]|uniref:Tyrosine-protein kinase n=1 Tax=Bursaphelenchus okinawaensis TaxID=465554 RepID=A0A811K5G7_9BILA|nr:unnamed protein product [Bursaphelenchus okinawaensis]CAG9092941.1 unnamed protein product [Bursaphelenchus okinawaensis]